MKMTTEYFDNHAELALEFAANDGSRFWEYSSPNNMDVHIDMMESEGYKYCGMQVRKIQADEHVRKFLNTVEYNRRHHPMYARLSFMKVLDIALKKGLEI